MLPELGYFCLILLSLTATVQLGLSLYGEIRQQLSHLALNPFFSHLQWLFAFGAYGCLVYAFMADDFSLPYVAAHSNSQLPAFFKFAAVWGGHDGSMLFWLMALSFWSWIFCLFSNNTDRWFRYRSLAVLALIQLGFALFILSLSNPFERSFPPPPEGRDLNPMLQDVGLIFHPPLLYLGYVGFAVSFAMTLATLLGGVLSPVITRWIRPWVLIAWGFLTAGILLGAWWAYYELGWGGWWFWDPVENASLMPWLLGTALLHSLIVSERRGIFSYWSILLAIFAFALSLLGTFIVRSGVLTSVHAFAVDEERGVALLLLFFSLSFIALALFALRTRLWQKVVHFALLSKESALLSVNGLFCVATVVVILGTFYPMIFSALELGTISVGAPYFNSIFLPLALSLLSMMGFATVLRWQQLVKRELWYKLALFPFAVALCLILTQDILERSYLHTIQWVPSLFISLAFWLILTHLPYKWAMWRLRPLAMRLAHIGFALALIGAMSSSYYADEVGVRMKPETEQELAGFVFKYRDFQYGIGENFTAERATFSLWDQGKVLAEIHPQRNYYDVRTMTMAEVGLYHHGLDDVYIVMGDKLGLREYAFRLHYKPLISALWLGGLLMIIAVLLAVAGLATTRKEIIKESR